MRVVGITLSVASAVQVEVEQVSTSPISALQSQMSMVESEIKRSGKITPGVYETIKKLQSMVENIIEPAIQESHAVDQMLVHKVFSEITECDATYTKFLSGQKKQAELSLRTVKTKWDHCGGSLEERKQKFAECLDHRDILVQANNTKCCQAHAMCPSPTGYGDCEIVKLEQGFVGCNYRTKTGDECFAHAKKLVAPLTGFFEGQDRKYELARMECEKFHAATKAKIAECAYLQQSVQAIVDEATEIGEQVNKGAEKAQELCKDECAKYKQCRMSKIEQYLELVGPCNLVGDYGTGGECVKNREADRVKEWDATQTIKCMLDHYCTGGKFEEELMQKCKDEITTLHLNIVYPTLTEEIPCEIADCPSCPGCEPCVDRPYYQYQTPCYAPPLPEVPVCVEQGECPDWCTEQ
jgi:hypothetical protein